MHIKTGNVFKLYSLISEATLRYQCLRYQELTEIHSTESQRQV